MPVEAASAGDVVYPPGGRLGPRAQLDLQLVLVHSGSARIMVDDEPERRLRPGQTGLLLPGHRERFAFARDSPTRHSWVQARLASPLPALLARFAALPRVLPTSTALGDLVREAVAVARGSLPTAEPLLAALAAAALWRYAGEAEQPPPGDPLERARRFLHANLGTPGVGLAQVAAAASTSAPHLVQSFRAELGTTPMAYLWEHRVAAGIDLLAHTGLPVGEIATRFGFASVYHFSRRVKAATGLPPTHVRAARWGPLDKDSS